MGPYKHTKGRYKLGFIEGLSKLDEELSKQGEYPDREKATWVSIKDKESVKVVPLQEFDEGSPNYSAKNGLARTYLEHSNPGNFKLQAECTVNEGSCYGCEQGWRQKRVLYINVLVDNGTDEPYVAILSRGFGKNSPADILRGAAADEDFNNSITDKVWKYSRAGTGTDSVYSISPLPKGHKYKVEDYDMWDLSQAVFHVDPEKQERYYTTGRIKGDDNEKSLATAGAPANAAAAVDVDW